MRQYKQLGPQQFAALVFHFTIGSTILIIPSALANAAKQDAWLSALIGVIVGLLLVCLYNILEGMHPELNIVEYSEQILGKWLGKAVSLLFCLFALLTASLVLRNLGDFITIEMLPTTPIEAIHVPMLLVAVIAVRLDLETLGRAAEIFFLVVIVIFILTVTLILPHATLHNIQPILGQGIKPVLLGSTIIMGIPYFELVLLLMLFPYVNNVKGAKKSFLFGTALSGFCLTLITLACLIGLSPIITELVLYPTFYVVKKINVADFIQRVEAGLAVLWFISVFFKLAICFFAAVISLSHTLNLKSYRSLAMPMAMIIFVLSLIAFPNITYFREFAAKIGPFYTGTFGLVLPLILLIGALIRKRLSGKSKKSRKPYTRG